MKAIITTTIVKKKAVAVFSNKIASQHFEIGCKLPEMNITLFKTIICPKT